MCRFSPEDEDTDTVPMPGFTLEVSRPALATEVKLELSCSLNQVFQAIGSLMEYSYIESWLNHRVIEYLI